MIKPMALDEYAVNFWTRVHDVEFSDKNSFVKNLITYLIASFSIPEDIVLTRGYIIRAYGKDILTFKSVFFKSSAKSSRKSVRKSFHLLKMSVLQ